VKDTRGFTLVELMIVMAIVGVLLSISIAMYRSARLQGSEAAAIAALDAINQAQFAYMQTCAKHQGYAPTLVELGMPVPGSPSGFLSPDMTVGEQVHKSGYVLQMAGAEVNEAVQSCTGTKPVTGYQATADPSAPGVTGVRFFATNTDRVIYDDATTFTGKMPERGAPQQGRELKPITGR
jgi:prepilin-type N-terminal cleavage/methylation domain-containing protein